MHRANSFAEADPESADAFAMQLALSRVHARLVPMQRVGGSYEIAPGAEAWFVLPAARGLAGYGLSRALRMLLDVLRGLSALHETFTASLEPFAHGEVALTQFRVDLQGVCRLVPLASWHAAARQEPPSAAVLGHLAPERLLGVALDARADVFSAGILLWEALAGRRLFEEATSQAIIDRLLAEKLQMPQLPPELAWAIPLKSVAARALAVDPQQRFSGCAELATAVAIVAREHVATHAEVANFLSALARVSERPVPSSPASGRSAQRAKAAATTGARERPVPNQSQTFPAVAAPSSRSGKRSTLAPLGPASSRPPAPELAQRAAPTTAASDPDFTSQPRSVRSSSVPPSSARTSYKSPFAALLLPPARVPPAQPAGAQVLSSPATAGDHVPSTKSTFSAVVAPLPLIVEPASNDASVAPKRGSGRKLWTALAVLSLGAASTVAALTHGFAPSKARLVTVAAAEPAQAPSGSNSSGLSERPAPAPELSARAAASSAASTNARGAHPAAHQGKRVIPSASRPRRKDYGL